MAMRRGISIGRARLRLPHSIDRRQASAFANASADPAEASGDGGSARRLAEARVRQARESGRGFGDANPHTTAPS